MSVSIFTVNQSYPFGMLMPGRSNVTGNVYRYSINGQEKEIDLNENITNAKYWEYDSRIGKRWNTDPVIKVWESPYASFGNNPIFLVDPDGLDWYKNTKTGDAKWFKGNAKHTGYKYLGNKEWGNKHLFFNTKKSLLPEVVVVGLPKKLNIEKENSVASQIEEKKEKVDVVNGVLELVVKHDSKIGVLSKGVGKVSETYSVGKGMYEMATGNPNFDPFSSTPIYGAVFSISNDLLEEREKGMLMRQINLGYANAVDFLTNSSIGKRSGIIGVYATEEVFQKIITQGYLDHSLPLRTASSNRQFQQNPTNENGIKYSYFILFKNTSEERIKEFTVQKIK